MAKIEPTRHPRPVRIAAVRGVSVEHGQRQAERESKARPDEDVEQASHPDAEARLIDEQREPDDDEDGECDEEDRAERERQRHRLAENQLRVSSSS